jgi:membrane associated rhomboid family serine protease
MLIYWMVLQVFGGLTSVGGEGGGVAFFAHLGGFIAGLVLIKFFTKENHLVAHTSQHYVPRW